MASTYSDIPPENLDTKVAKLGGEDIRHIRGKMSRIVPVHNRDEKEYYYMTDYFEPRALYCTQTLRQYGKRQYRTYKFKITKTYRDGHNRDDQPNPKNVLIDELNTFKQGLTNKISFMTKIPGYEDHRSYSFLVNTTKDDKMSNILMYDNRKTSLPYDTVTKILSQCRCRFLIHIMSMSITDNNVFFNLRISRINPEYLDALPANDLTFILNSVNSNTIENMNRLKELNNVNVRRKYVSKSHVKQELKKILCES